MKQVKFLLILLSFALIGLVSCRTGPVDKVVEVTPTAAAAASKAAVDPTAAPVIVAEPGKNLTICMAQEPATLYWHGRSTLFDEAVLHGLYENDFSILSFDYQAQGLQSIPSLEQGDVTFRVVPVDAGDEVVDAAGDVVALDLGMIVVDADGELVTFDGSTLLMQQMVVDFNMKQRFWADGKPVAAADSVYSFRLAAHPETPGDKFKIARTASYEATGSLSIRWAGLPGFKDETFQTNFLHPLPQHAWQGLSEAELVTADASSRLPLGDGPYQIVEWLPGEMIRLEPNPFYYRLPEDLPRLESVTFEFIPDTSQRISKLLAGQCQLITHEKLDPELIPFFQEAQNAQLLQAAFRPGPIRWQIDFGINSWNGYGDGTGRPDWFEDPRVRQAVAMCINRQEIVDSVLYGQSFVPNSTLPPSHPLIAQDARQWPYDSTAANVLLDEAGYSDSDRDRIREDPIRGDDFRVSLITSEDRDERQIAALIKENLLECGINLVVESLPDQLRFSAGEENRINGRRFDLALTSSPVGPIPVCDTFVSGQISGPESEQNSLTGLPFGGWEDKNHSGWSSPDYDAICAAAMNAMPGTEAFSANHLLAQVVFAEQLPALPLFFTPRTTAAAPNVLHINNDPSQNSELWNLFAIDLVE